MTRHLFVKSKTYLVYVDDHVMYMVFEIVNHTYHQLICYVEKHFFTCCKIAISINVFIMTILSLVGKQ